ncbi:putative hyperosmotically inducible periplasmic protein [Candidatus Protochlamydia naegleriophila]|uniref:Putative hyperosmotically inducible periplasmic protein n=1 Tax=Candidatus Protochlamydia naegleriophila TaxID=389348 RepID=A0A0U5JA74_9BACT|nr:BON domain-containing protein [Candidatus Protochlamydia naegleriophila]CUI16318.1 putative hyperosmotically inducible periplasmic protein [Candidatus Protochlamydia naegleriophila]
MKKQLFILSSLCLMLSACENTAHNTAPGADNTARNARNGHAVTAGDQAENEADRGITQKVRQALLEDDSLSTNAKNIKIITINGVITLRGPVNNDREKNEIGKKAKAVSGVRNVDNQLEVIREVNVNRLDNAMRSEGRSDINR